MGALPHGLKSVVEGGGETITIPGPEEARGGSTNWDPEEALWREPPNGNCVL